MKQNGWFLCLVMLASLCWAGVASAQDMQVTALASSNNSPKYNTTIDVSLTIANPGNQATVASVATIRLSTNSSITTSDRLIANVNVPVIAANGTYKTTVKVTIPPDMGTGTRWLGVTADANGQVAESNENNNIRSIQLLVQVGSAPDLTPSALTLSKTTLSIGETITVNFTVNNIGNGPSVATTATIRLSSNTTISLSDVELTPITGSLAIPTLAAGASHKGTVTVKVTQAFSSNYIGIFVDPTTSSTAPGKVAESNENNNTRNVQVTLTAPDLTVRDMLVTPGNFAAGSTITVTANIVNIGTTAANASTLEVYFSTNTLVDRNDRLAGTVNIPTIAAGATYALKQTISVTAAMMQGYTSSFYVLGLADAKSILSEGNENNNVGNYRVNVNGIDLVATSIKLSTTTIAPGGKVDVTYTIRNNGNRSSNATTVYIVYSTDDSITTADTRLATVNLPALSAGASTTLTQTGVTVPTNASAGATRYIGIYADATRRNTETNETNNELGAPFTIPSFNLQTTAITVNPNSVPLGGKVTVTFTIKNTGTAQVGASVAGFYISTNSAISTGDALIQTANIPAIAAGKEYKGSVVVTIPSNNNRVTPGARYIGVYADQPNNIRETNENYTDNARGTALTISIDADLQPTKATPSNTSPTQGQTITLATIVKNNGTQSARGTYLAIYYSKDNKWDSQDTYLARDYYNTIAAGATSTESASIRIPATATIGTGYLIVRADYLNYLAESNETNNTLAVAITIKGTPDLNPSSLTPSTTKPIRGTSMSATVVVKNIGGAATTAAALSIYLSSNTTLGSADTFLGTTTLPIIQAGQQASVTLTNLSIPATQATGRYYLLAFADSQRNVTEANESNNIANAAIDIIATPIADLTIPNLSGVPSNAKAGDTTTLSLTVKNGGTADAATSSTAFYLSKSSTPTASDVLLGKLTTPLLKAGASTNQTKAITIPTGTTPGAYTLHVVADDGKTITEADEGNNVTSVPIIIGVTTDPDKDKDGSPASKDCDDNDKTVYPGAKEICDGKDNNCDKKIDEGNLCPAGQTCDSTAKQCVKVVVEAPPADAGPADTPTGCPGGCPSGQICVRNTCIPLPDSDEPSPEETNTETTPTETTADSPSGNDTNTTIDDTTSDQNNIADTQTGNDTNTTIDQTKQPDDSTKQDTPTQTDKKQTDNDPIRDNTTTPEKTTITENGSTSDTNNTTEQAPPGGGCGCHSNTNNPFAPLLLFMLLVLGLAFRKRNA